MLASVLQQSGYKVGLYTSPHLKSFTERILINGQAVDEAFVVEFVEAQREFIETAMPSFFEVTVAMAFSYFAKQGVDMAVVEVGMGGRLDSTNIIVPEVSVITNISFDHMQYLGDTLPKIAAEKAGIIKPGVPVVVSELADQEVIDVFVSKASEANATLYLAENQVDLREVRYDPEGLHLRAIEHTHDGSHELALMLDLSGNYQEKNVRGVLVALWVLQQKGYTISEKAIFEGLARVKETTGLKGRWQTLQWEPRVICDTAHNQAGLQSTLQQLGGLNYRQLRFVLGFVADKDLATILALFPKQATYYFCQPSNPRAIPATQLALKALEYGITGESYDNVNKALEMALKDSSPEDVIYVGGSTFVVADLDQL
jgi:dihydrofolate synthase / folylpolyglutamate synthase